MSNGEQDRPASPYSRMEFDGPTLLSLLAPEVSAIQDAKGDVRAAIERMIDAVQRAQKEVNSREDALSDQQRTVSDRLTEFGLIGRMIDITAGTALGAIDESEDDEPYLIREAEGENLAGNGGVITGFEVGSFMGKPIGEDEIVLFVDVDKDKGHLAFGGVEGYRYAFIANQAEFTAVEPPQPDEQ